MDEGELEIFAGEFAAFVEFGKKAAGKFIEICDAAAQCVGPFEDVGDESFGFESSERLGVQRDLHDELSPPVAIHGLIGFPAGFLGTFILAAVPSFLALRQSDFDLGNAIAEIDTQWNDGQAF